ncbi:MAG: caspase family protein [Alphaproteobacteria bacterium]|nr:caspase family protein [Alphaproteobacteria bacterium]
MANKALLIGVNNYDGGVLDLEGCVADVAQWQAQIDRLRFDSVKLLTRPKTTTRSRIEKEVKRLAKELEEGDKIVVFFAGHGDVDIDASGEAKRRFVCPSDVATEGRIDIDAAILGPFRRKTERFTLVVILDSCFSGQQPSASVPAAEMAASDSEEASSGTPVVVSRSLRPLALARPFVPERALLDDDRIVVLSSSTWSAS